MSGRALAAALAAVLLASPLTESAKIDALIQSVADLRDAKFVRNGVEYEAEAAADHLRTKRERAGSRVRTAEDFIRYCGSSSSMTGKPYEIHWADGRVTTSESFLRARLAELEKLAPP